MYIKECIDEIVKSGNTEDMEKLSEIMENAIYDVKNYNEEKYNKYKLKLYTMIYGNVLSENMAEEITHKMKPDGEHWTLEQTNNVKQQYGLDQISDVDFYVVMNMAWNDYKNIFGENLENYVKYTKAFILDEDAKKDKVFIYFTQIPKKD